MRPTTESQRRSAAVRARRAAERDRGKPTTQFRRIMEYAVELARKDPLALPLLITALGRTIQAQAVLEPVLHRLDRESPLTQRRCLIDEFCPLDAGGRTFADIATRIVHPRRLQLRRDVVLPWPWRKERLANAMHRLRPGGSWGSWRQDSNHQVELWEPLGIGWSHGGNHSLAVGLLLGQGTVKPVVAYDISPVYEHVTCDGRVFRRRHDGAILSEVASVELAAIFEIGRLVVEFRSAPSNSVLTR